MKGFSMVMNEIGKVVKVRGVSYLILEDGRIFKFEDSDINPRISPVNPEETDKLALYFLDLKIRREKQKQLN